MSEIYNIIPAQEFRNTDKVKFHFLPILDDLKGIDRVEHAANAISPGSIDDVERPWYMHPHQVDNLIVFAGTRHVELYTKELGEIVQLDVTAKTIIKDGELLFEGPAMLSWPTFTYHRISSGAEGSLSVNFAVREEDFDIKTNFNIYDLDIETGVDKVIREGHLDQKNVLPE